MSLTGGIVLRYDELYSDASLNYNRAFDYFPSYINLGFKRWILITLTK